MRADAHRDVDRGGPGARVHVVRSRPLPTTSHRGKAPSTMPSATSYLAMVAAGPGIRTCRDADIRSRVATRLWGRRRHGFQSGPVATASADRASSRDQWIGALGALVLLPPDSGKVSGGRPGIGVLSAENAEACCERLFVQSSRMVEVTLVV